MDDLILIHESAEKLEICKSEIVAKLNELGFTINPNKTRIYHMEDGINFLGFTYHLSETGKVYLIPEASKIKTGRKKYRRLVAKSKRGLVPRENVDMSFHTWIDHLSHGNSQQLIKRLTDYYNKLWEE
jgi:hypothetical protein